MERKIQHQAMIPDDRIFEIAMELIREGSMKHDLWQVTRLASIHPDPSLPMQCEDGERMVVSAQFPNGDWYAWTTRWLVSFLDGHQTRLRSSAIHTMEFGPFKGHPALINKPQAPLQSLVATARDKAGRALRFRYELGYASMGPVQFHKYWQIKHPILHKLFTPCELEAYRRAKSAR